MITDPKMIDKIKENCDIILERLKTKHIGCFKDHTRPVMLISETYPGIWMEHFFDSVCFAEIDPAYAYLAQSTVEFFIDYQKEDGQLPCYITDPAKPFPIKNDSAAGYAHIQECVSIGMLILRIYGMTKDRDFLVRAYEALKKWDNWLKCNRMTSNRGLIEAFCGYDTGHDNSLRFKDFSCPGNFNEQNAAIMPQDDVVPVLAPDMNAVFYADKKALAEMSRLLETGEEERWESEALTVKENLFVHCYDENDEFFYDVDKHGNKIKIRSISIINVFASHILDQDTADRIYKRYMRNPNEFWTEYPFPSVAVSDPNFVKNIDKNSWNYHSQGNTALRTLLWMEHYGKEDDMKLVMEKWLLAWTASEDIRFGQELDPFTGIPSQCSQYYSTCMLFYLRSAKKLGVI